MTPTGKSPLRRRSVPSAILGPRDFRRKQNSVGDLRVAKHPLFSIFFPWECQCKPSLTTLRIMHAFRGHNFCRKVLAVLSLLLACICAGLWSTAQRWPVLYIQDFRRRLNRKFWDDVHARVLQFFKKGFDRYYDIYTLCH